jgi:hypothetical protein
LFSIHIALHKNGLQSAKKTKNNLFKQTDKNPQEGQGREAAFGHITGQNTELRLLSKLPVKGR